MTGTAGIIMWLIMGLTIAAMASGAITWAKQRLQRQSAQRPQLQAPGTMCAAAGPASRDPPVYDAVPTRISPHPPLHTSRRSAV
jgi:hypothetical protein